MSVTNHHPNLVLVHGWGLGNTAWEEVLPALTQRFRVHLSTLPGYSTPEYLMDKQSSQPCSEEAHEQTAFSHIVCRTPFDAPYSESTPHPEPPPLQGEGWGGDGEIMIGNPDHSTPHYPHPPTSRPLVPQGDFLRGKGGGTPKPVTDADFFQASQALAAALPENCILCGWSLGSLLALQAASVAPQRIKQLILIGGTPSFTQRADWPHAQPPALLDTFCDAIASDAAGTLKRFIALFNQGDKQARLIGRAMIKQLLARPLPDTATLLAGLGWLRDVDLRQRITSITVPTRLIHGENDPLMPLAAAQWLKETLPNAQLEVFSGAAHAPFLNDPDRFAKLIGDEFHASALH